MLSGSVASFALSRCSPGGRHMDPDHAFSVRLNAPASKIEQLPTCNSLMDAWHNNPKAPRRRPAVLRISSLQRKPNTRGGGRRWLHNPNAETPDPTRPHPVIASGDCGVITGTGRLPWSTSALGFPIPSHFTRLDPPPPTRAHPLVRRPNKRRAAPPSAANIICGQLLLGPPQSRLNPVSFHFSDSPPEVPWNLEAWWGHHNVISPRHSVPCCDALFGLVDP
jgi:hypothetical protein